MKDYIVIIITIAFLINILLLIGFYTIYINSIKIKNLLFAIAFLEFKKASKDGIDIKLEDIYQKGKNL